MKLLNRIVFLIFVTSIIFLSGCIQDEDMNIRSTAIPEKLNDGWKVAGVKDEGFSQVSIDNMYNCLYDQNAYYNALGLIMDLRRYK
jgi:hypothetical protein